MSVFTAERMGSGVFRIRFLFSLPIMLLLCLGCGSAKDYGKERPSDQVVDVKTLYREWKSQGASIDLLQNKTFDAKGLRTNYFSCTGTSDRETKILSGSGSWSSAIEGSATAVYLKFGTTGCTTTLWVGDIKGEKVLWGNLDSDGIVTLR